MLLKLFLLFTLIPVIEIYLLIKISSLLGPLSAIALILSTGFAGASLARLQGMNTMMNIRRSLQEGIMPTEDLIDGFLILLAGIVLITPGLLTDILGLLLLFPKSRNMFKEYAKSEFSKRMQNGSINVSRF